MEQLKQILRNLKKTPNRQYKKTTLIKKLKELETVKFQFIKELSLEKNSKTTSNSRLEFCEIYEVTKVLLNKKLEETEEEENSEEEKTGEEEENSEEEEESSELNRTLTEEETMSNFSIDTAIKAIPNFSGNYKELDSFSTIVTLINSSLNEAGKTDLLNFAFHVKLSNNVKTALGSQSPPANLDSLISSLKLRYKNNVTLPQILNKLSNITQRNQNIASFKDHLLNTISDLNRLQIEQLGSDASEIQKQVIITTNDIQALHIFKNGLDDRIKTTVIAAQPKTLTDAVNIALEVETNNSNQIMYINRAGNNTRYNNNNNRYNNNNNRYYNNSNRNSNFSNNNNNNFNRNRNFSNRNPNNSYNTNSYRNNNNQSFNTNNNYNSNRNTHNNNHRNYNNKKNQQQRNTNNNNNNYRNNTNNNNNNNRAARVHLTNEQGNNQGSDYNNPESQN